MWRILVAIPVAFLLIGVHIADSVSAHLDFGGYIYCDGTTSCRKDPVNLLFTEASYAWLVDYHVVEHDLPGWTHQDGSNMWFMDHGTLDLMDYQRADDGWWSARKHMRTDEGRDSSSVYGVYTIGAVHRDKVTVPCSGTFIGHRGYRFNEMRNYVGDQFAVHGHPVQRYGYYKGNELPSTNCDGTQYAGDGWLSIIEYA